MSIRISRRSASLFAAIAPYQTLQDRARQAVADMGGKVVDDQPDQGLIVAKWSHRLHIGGLRVRLSFRAEDNQTITVDSYGYFNDALDTFGSAGRRAAEVIDQLIELLVAADGAILDQATPQVGASPPPAAPLAYAAPVGGQPMAIAAQPQSTVGASHHGMAQGAFWSSLIGLLMPVIGIVAIILAGISLSAMGRSGNSHGKGMAITGLILGIVDVTLGSIIWAVAFSSGG